MRYFFTQALDAKSDDREGAKTALLDTVAIASQVCNYRHPKLATVKVGGDRENPLMVREGVTSKQVMEELRQKILETGLLPSKLVDVTPLHRGDHGCRLNSISGLQLPSSQACYREVPIFAGIISPEVNAAAACFS